MDENLSDSRPPLKVRIKLNQVRYPIILHENFTKSPIFPEPSDDSDTDDDLKNSITVNAGFSCSSSKKSPMHSNTERQPIKIKMKTLLTKMNSCDKGEDLSLMDGEQKASFDDMKCKERADVHFYISDSESEPEPISHGNVIFETNSNSESSSSVNSDSEDEIQGTIENILDSRDGDKEQCDKHGNNHKSAQIQVPDEHLSDYDDDSGN
ncbi:hypothetical protein DPMN_011232 [Dreissena polymorpha]|uniref:Uncharacterized protein n=1 Tax=Dreissena polymorpha TaxID=45954 RepID=A0A9D4N3N5_DREPO|nr:hypothetical protein DPMN_011232 [Dreissena polymorpha]